MKTFARWLYMKMYHQELIALKRIVLTRAVDYGEANYTIGVIDALKTLNLLKR